MCFSTDFFRPYFHKTLKTDEIRANKRFFPYKEMNGKYSVESQDQEVRDYDTECDYVFVHFSLPMESPLVGGTVNVFGALTQWNANKGNEMTYNFDNSTYELTLLLKQGYYNFMYVYVPQGARVADHTNIEGSFWETENDYQIFVYYRDLAGALRPTGGLSSVKFGGKQVLDNIHNFIYSCPAFLGGKYLCFCLVLNCPYTNMNWKKLENKK